MEERRQIHPVVSPNAVVAGGGEATSTVTLTTSAVLPVWTARGRRPRLMLSLQGLRSEAARVGVGVEVLRRSQGELRSFATNKCGGFLVEQNMRLSNAPRSLTKKECAHAHRHGCEHRTSIRANTLSPCLPSIIWRQPRKFSVKAHSGNN